MTIRLFRLISVCAVLMILSGSGRLAVAQTPAEALDPEELPARVFDARDGVPRTVLTRVKALSEDGSLWLGSDHGAFKFDGRRWVRYAMPDSLPSMAVRDFSYTPDGSTWLATRAGVLRDSAGTQSWFPLKSAPVWNLVRAKAIDPSGPLLATTRDGLFRWTGRGFDSVPLPPGFSSRDLVAAQTVRDGVPSLWVGSLSGGVARLREGRWTVFDNSSGLPANARIEHFAIAPAEDAVEVVATAIDGIYTFSAERWTRIRIGSTVHLRSARIIRNGRPETWTALTNGDLYTDGGTGQWRVLRPAGRTPSGSAQALSVVREGDGSFLVFVGYRGGELVRFRIGRAETVKVPPIARGRTTRIIFNDRDARTYFSTQGSGLFAIMRGQVQSISDSLDVTGMLRASPAVGGALWVSTRQHGVWTEVNGRLRPDGPIWNAPDIGALGEGPGPDGRSALIIGTTTGRLLVRQPRGWVAWDSVPFTSSIRALIGHTVEGRPVLWVSVPEGVWRWDGRTWTAVRLPPDVRTVDFVRIFRPTTASASRDLYIATLGAGLLRVDTRAADPVAVPLSVPQPLDGRTRFVKSAMAMADGSILLGSTDGLIRLVVNADGKTAQVTSVFTDEDGLPHSDVTALSPAGSDGRVWVGTLGGLAMLDMTAPARAEQPHELSVVLRQVGLQGNTASRLSDRATVPWSAKELEADFVLRTDYREDDVYYRYELDGPARISQTWTTTAAVPFRTLPSGSYRLRVWASRAYGPSVGPVVHSFSVAPPFWRSPLALAFYALGLVGGVWAVTAWRTAALRRRERELLENEHRLAESERRFRLLFDQSADAQLLTDGSTVVAANSAAGVLLADSVEATSVRGMDISALVPSLAGRWQETSADAVETEIKTQSGEMRPVLMRRIPMPQGGTLLAHVELRDLRVVRQLAQERAELEQQLRESQRLEALGTLAGGVAHDFNNLLTVIRNGAKMAKDALAHGAADPESLEAILQASARARDLVRQILTFSRRLPSGSDPIVVHELLQDLQPMLRASLPSTVRVVIEERAADAVIRGDRTQLVQVLVNLATNAEFAMRGRADGVLTLRTDLVTLPLPGIPLPAGLASGPHLRLRVTDTGYGMRDDVREHIFEPFFTTKPVGEGTGLGLSVLHGIITSHHGATSVESTVGVGTTFEILLPTIQPVPADVLVAPTAAAAASTTRKLHVLLADDEPSVLSATRRILTRQGFVITACGGGAEAIRALQGSEPFDVLLTDLTMPDITGEALAIAARTLRPGLPVILITGFGGEVAQMAHDAGVREVLAKPYELPDLLAAIGRVVEG